MNNWDRANPCPSVFVSPSPTPPSIWQLKSSGTALNFAQLLTFLQNEIFYQTGLGDRMFAAINQPMLTHGFDLVTEEHLTASKARLAFASSLCRFNSFRLSSSLVRRLPPARGVPPSPWPYRDMNKIQSKKINSKCVQSWKRSLHR